MRRRTGAEEISYRYRKQTQWTKPTKVRIRHLLPTYPPPTQAVCKSEREGRRTGAEANLSTRCGIALNVVSQGQRPSILWDIFLHVAHLNGLYMAQDYSRRVSYPLWRVLGHLPCTLIRPSPCQRHRVHARWPTWTKENLRMSGTETPGGHLSHLTLFPGSPCVHLQLSPIIH